MRRFLDFFQEGLRNLLRHKMRSALTLLGVIFGIAAVVAMQGIAAGAQATVLKQIAGLGLRNVIVDSVQPTQQSANPAAASRSSRRMRLNFGITYRDADQLRAALPQADVAQVHRLTQRVYVEGRRAQAVAAGVEPLYFELMNTSVVEGHLLTQAHEWTQANVAVINEAFAQATPGLERQPIGRVLKLGRRYFEVIGVVRVPAHLEERRIYIPYETARREFGNAQVSSDTGTFNYSRSDLGQLVLRLPQETEVEGAQSVVESLLERNHPGTDDWSVRVPLRELRNKQETQRIFNLVLITIAAISLLVGGIGIMNIMLASVSERIPEIGIRRAVGATRRDVLAQFLVETATLTAMGGLLGSLLGVVSVPIAARFTGWPGLVTPSSILVALVVSVGVGLVFGMAPAWRASRLDPGVALRH
jgi:putative ABC transport system permease protein